MRCDLAAAFLHKKWESMGAVERSWLEMTFCLRPVHALGGPVLGGILSGRQSMVGSTNLEERLTSAETVLQRIERGLRRLA